ncbi:hypothetical protein [Streptomyces mirabilis]
MTLPVGRRPGSLLDRPFAGFGFGWTDRRRVRGAFERTIEMSERELRITGE